MFPQLAIFLKTQGQFALYY